MKIKMGFKMSWMTQRCGGRYMGGAPHLAAGKHSHVHRVSVYREVGSGRCCSPRHRMPCNSRNDSARSVAESSTVVIGCHLTKELGIQYALNDLVAYFFGACQEERAARGGVAAGLADAGEVAGGGGGGRGGGGGGREGGGDRGRGGGGAGRGGGGAGGEVRHVQPKQWAVHCTLHPLSLQRFNRK